MIFGENPLFFNLLYKNIDLREIIVYQWVEQILKSNVNRAYLIAFGGPFEAYVEKLFRHCVDRDDGLHPRVQMDGNFLLPYLTYQTRR
uniref:Uncharacterized protein n=1 Tax=Candidatus Kentrum eta TaxID=2126337 RepID=A0A450VK88_9GAMM|nr:MAG: hypothetical protein BECKH772A_GA0070896_104303 [Candidatus Kentron sp. H]VFK05130.1 MAG: hypothetical protein BECKH772B_GA0070898_105361 [Candidatus Kentron sp. H]VFK08610.1 MAG: hypothetical protein BECKH772C_GA0070978_105282 [Candidatus Kentron sp. H]